MSHFQKGIDMNNYFPSLGTNQNQLNKDSQIYQPQGNNYDYMSMMSMQNQNGNFY